MNQQRVIIVGATISGLLAACALAQRHVPVLIVSASWQSEVPTQSGGLVVPLTSEGCLSDEGNIFFETHIKRSEFLAPQKILYQVASQAKALLDYCIRLGLPFNSTCEGFPRIYPHEGSLQLGQLFADFNTSAKLYKLLMDQVCQWQKRGLISWSWGVEVLSFVQNSKGLLQGIVGMDQATLEVKAYQAEAVIVACEGPVGLFCPSTQKLAGGAGLWGTLLKQGVSLTNLEFVQKEPFSFLWSGLAHGMTQPLMHSGARVYVKRGQSPWYFLEDLYPGFKNRLPDLVIEKAMEKALAEATGDPRIYVDLDGVKSSGVEWEGFKRLLTRWGDRTLTCSPAIHQVLGGVAVDDHLHTNMKGLFACGEGVNQLHGAYAISSHHLLLQLYSGMQAAISVDDYVHQMTSSLEIEGAPFDAEIKREVVAIQDVLASSGGESVWLLREELSHVLTQTFNSIITNKNLKWADQQISELGFRVKRISVSDKNGYLNQEIVALRRFEGALVVASAMIKAASCREESRGVFLRAEFSKKEDRFLKRSRVSFIEGALHLAYEDCPLVFLKS